MSSPLRNLILLAVVSTLAVMAGCAKKQKGPPTPSATAADAIYVGGDIVTISDAQPTAEALAVKDGKILAVGARVDIEKAHKGTATQVVDLRGKTLMPSFIDAHSHYINSLLVANQAKLYAPPSGPGKDVPSIIAELKKFAAERNIPNDEMIMGYGYDDTVMPDGRLLNRDDLDAAFPDNPVRVDHVSMHGAVMNSLALKKYGFSAKAKTPSGGVIVRKPGTEEPYGLIMGRRSAPDQPHRPCGRPARPDDDAVVSGEKIRPRLTRKSDCHDDNTTKPPSACRVSGNVGRIF